MVDAPLDVEFVETIRAIKAAAVRYRNLTGKPLGITGELGEVQAARILGLKLAPPRQAGFDATDASGRRLQIKARCILEDAKPGQRVGSIKLNHEWDAVVLLLMDHNFEPQVAFEASREAVEAALKLPGSRARNERGALAVSKFKSIGKRVWSRDQPKPA